MEIALHQTAVLRQTTKRISQEMRLRFWKYLGGDTSQAETGIQPLWAFILLWHRLFEPLESTHLQTGGAALWCCRRLPQKMVDDSFAKQAANTSNMVDMHCPKEDILAAKHDRPEVNAPGQAQRR